MKNKILAVIPARYASTRFEGKPLAMINDKPMVMWVYDAAVKSGLFDKTVVATDDTRIYDAVKQYSGEVIMTSNDLKNGTERCLQTLSLLEKEGLGFDIVINIQGDEPLIQKKMMECVISGFENQYADIVTLKKAIETQEELNDRNIVKVVCNKDGRALYFSRSAIPFCRDNNTEELIQSGKYFKHIGIYGYRSSVLKKIVHLEESFLEKTEKLEQLRWLENGYNIVVKMTDTDTVGVDTKEDLEKIIRIINTK